MNPERKIPVGTMACLLAALCFLIAALILLLYRQSYLSGAVNLIAALLMALASIALLRKH